MVQQMVSPEIAGMAIGLSAMGDVDRRVSLSRMVVIALIARHEWQDTLLILSVVVNGDPDTP